MELLRNGAAPNSPTLKLAAAWDFSKKVDSDHIIDSSEYQLHGRTVNSPKRAVTGYNWTGREANFGRAPEEYGAIHFHEDDLDDCKWKPDIEFQVPGRFRTGIYALKLEAEGHKDYVPFFVRPGRGRPTAKIVFLAPTFSYLAYANDHYISDPELQRRAGMPKDFRYPVTNIDKYLVSANLLSLYDKHSDGSGVCYASRLRPILTMRPDYLEAVQSDGRGAPHQFPADLWITDWMEAKGFKYDVMTDDDLHNEGLGLLSPYRVVVTGTHPEYWTEQMLSAMDRYLEEGGRLMYMGGNGFYWVTSVDPSRPHIIEVRRWGGTQSWTSDPGEYYHSTTGELGGLWRNRNRPPQKMLGVGFTAQGHGPNRAYRRLPDSFDPRAAFIFQGVGKDEVIGDFDCLDQGPGAAGYEFDRYDHALGTPKHALRLASATGFTDAYQHAIEEVDASDSKQGGTVNERVRADMVYFEYPNQGAVFSTGSVSWSGCLFYNNYENNVSRITENVLRNFANRERLGPQVRPEERK
jgi:N,N-dimethylformamidase